MDDSVAIQKYTLQRKLVLYRNFSCTDPLQSFFECDFMLTFKTDQGARIFAEIRPMVFQVAKVCPHQTFFQRRSQKENEYEIT